MRVHIFIHFPKGYTKQLEGMYKNSQEEECVKSDDAEMTEKQYKNIVTITSNLIDLHFKEIYI